MMIRHLKCKYFLTSCSYVGTEWGQVETVEGSVTHRYSAMSMSSAVRMFSDDTNEDNHD